MLWFLPSRKHFAKRGRRFRCWSVCLSRNAPPSVLIAPPAYLAIISRFPLPANPKLDWLHSVIAKAVLLSALTVVWKLSYAILNGLLPNYCEFSGLSGERGLCSDLAFFLRLPHEQFLSVH